MLTDHQHILLAAALGYPSCCITAWIEDRPLGIASGAERGGITMHVRSDAEIDALRPRLDAIAWEGWTDCMRTDPRAHYVPCENCRRLHSTDA